MRWVALAMALVWGCDDGGADRADAGGACLTSDLIAQCPPGSNPILGATADGLCSGEGAVDLTNMEGHVTGRCYREDACVVACQFASACRCGVQSVTRDGVTCVPCPDVDPCGDGVCSGGETPVSCPEDCAGDCQPGAMRCQGPAVESCTLRGRWEALACPQGEACVQTPRDPEPHCERDDIVVGGDAGVGVDAGPRISGRILFGRGELPAAAEVVRPGSGRGLAPTGLFGYFRRCGGNNAEQARCRSTISSNPRYRLISDFNAIDMLPTLSAEGELRLMGRNRVVAFGWDGFGPPAQRPEFAEFCAHHAAFCDPNAACDGEDVSALEAIYDAWSWGGPAMRCWIDRAEPTCVPSEACALEWRQRGYLDGVAPVSLNGAALSADARHLAFWDEGRAKVVDLSTGAVTDLGDTGAYPARPIRSLALSGDGRFVAAVGSTTRQFDADSLLVVWPRAGGAPVAAVTLDGALAQEVALNGDGSIAAVARWARIRSSFSNAAIDLINVPEQTRAWSVLPFAEENPPGRACFGHLNHGLAFSPRGDTLAFGMHAINGAGCQHVSRVEVWDLASRSTRHVLTGSPGTTANHIRYSPDGTTIAVGSNQSSEPADIQFELSTWDAESGARLDHFTNPDGLRGSGQFDLRYSVDGRSLLAWGNGTVEEWTVQFLAGFGPAGGE